MNIKLSTQKKSILATRFLITTLLLFARSFIIYGQSWVNVGSPGFSAQVISLTMTIDPSGIPYIAHDTRYSTEIPSVMKYNGMNWEYVGSTGIAGPGEAAYPSIAFDANGKPYVIYVDYVNGFKATVKMFNGSNWELVGNAGFSPREVVNPSIVINPRGTPYVIYQDFRPIAGTSRIADNITVMKYDGSNWVNVGNADFSSDSVNYPSIAMDTAGTPYVVFSDYSIGKKATVMKFNGTIWVNVGSAGLSSYIAEYTSIAIDANNTPYVVYKDGGGGDLVTVKKYDGSNWVIVGTPLFSAANVDYTTIAIDAVGTPYVAYKDYGNGKKATVMKYNGSSWVNVGSAGFSAADVNYTGIAIDGCGNPYVVYEDFGNGQKATVMKFDAPPIVPTIIVSGNTLSTSISYKTYQWELGGLPIAGATNATYTVMLNGAYSVKVNGCNAASDLTIITNVGVNNISNASGISIVPNPTTGALSVSGYGIAQIKVYNQIGQLMKETTDIKNLSISEYPAGLYFIRLYNEAREMIYTDKIIKE